MVWIMKNFLVLYVVFWKELMICTITTIKYAKNNRRALVFEPALITSKNICEKTTNILDALIAIKNLLLI
jgi:hypothetical protein